MLSSHCFSVHACSRIFIHAFSPLSAGVTMGLNKTQSWRPWTVDGNTEMAGYTIGWQEGQAQFVSLRGSGHLSPLNRPRATYEMMYAFTRGEKFPSYNAPLRRKKE